MVMALLQSYGLYSEYRPEIFVAHAEPGVESLGVGMSLVVFSHPVCFEHWGRSCRVIFTLVATDASRHVPAMRDLMALLSSEKVCDTLRYWSENTPETLYIYLAARLSECIA